MLENETEGPYFRTSTRHGKPSGYEYVAPERLLPSYACAMERLRVLRNSQNLSQPEMDVEESNAPGPSQLNSIPTTKGPPIICISFPSTPSESSQVSLLSPEVLENLDDACRDDESVSSNAASSRPAEECSASSSSTSSFPSLFLPRNVVVKEGGSLERIPSAPSSQQSKEVVTSSSGFCRVDNSDEIYGDFYFLALEGEEAEEEDDPYDLSETSRRGLYENDVEAGQMDSEVTSEGTATPSFRESPSLSLNITSTPGPQLMVDIHIDNSTLSLVQRDLLPVVESPTPPPPAIPRSRHPLHLPHVGPSPSQCRSRPVVKSIYDDDVSQFRPQPATRGAVHPPLDDRYTPPRPHSRGQFPSSYRPGHNTSGGVMPQMRAASAVDFVRKNSLHTGGDNNGPTSGVRPISQVYAPQRQPQISETRYFTATPQQGTSTSRPRHRYSNHEIAPLTNVPRSNFPPVSTYVPPPSAAESSTVFGVGENESTKYVGSMSSGRIPDVGEVVRMLSSSSPAVQYNAAAFVQHLTFDNVDNKRTIKLLNGVGPLIRMLSSPQPLVRRNAICALRNLSFGNDNSLKEEICLQDGIQAIVQLLQQSPQIDSQEAVEVLETATAVLWNLSSIASHRRVIARHAVHLLLTQILLPQAGLQRTPQGHYVAVRQCNHWSPLLRNAVGIIRNVSSEGSEVRQSLRQMPGLVDFLVAIVSSAVNTTYLDSKTVESCLCALRNLSYALQEIVDPTYLARRQQQAHMPRSSSMPRLGKSSKAAPQSNINTSTGCCSSNQTHRNASPPARLNHSTSSKRGRQPIASSGVWLKAPELHGEPAKGVNLLWQSDLVARVYLPVLAECNNMDSLEAAAGAIQNLTAGDWEPSARIREQVRKEKGLAVFAELLRLSSDSVTCACATALRNLSQDHVNRDLIGQRALSYFVDCLPCGPPGVSYAGESKKTSSGRHKGPSSVSSHEAPEPEARLNRLGYEPSLETIAACLAAIYAVVKESEEFAKSFFRSSGVARCLYLITHHSYYRDSTASDPLEQEKVPRFARQLLRCLWSFKTLRGEFRHAGYIEKDFIGPATFSTTATTSGKHAKAKAGDGGDSVHMSLGGETRDEFGSARNGGRRQQRQLFRVADGPDERDMGGPPTGYNPAEVNFRSPARDYASANVLAYRLPPPTITEDARFPMGSRDPLYAEVSRPGQQGSRRYPASNHPLVETNGPALQPGTLDSWV